MLVPLVGNRARPADRRPQHQGGAGRAVDRRHRAVARSGLTETEPKQPFGLAVRPWQFPAKPGTRLEETTRRMTSETDDLRLAADFAPASYDDWRKLVDGVLKGAPFEKLVGKTSDGLRIEPIYRRAAEARSDRRPRRGCALADHAADRSSRCCRRQRAGAARSRKRRHRADAGVCRRQRRLWLWAGTDGGSDRRSCSTACSSMPGLRSNCRSARNRGWPRSISPNIIKRKGIDPAACNIRFGLDPLGACAVWGSSPYSWAGDRAGGDRRDQGPRRAGLQGPVRARRWPGDP